MRILACKYFAFQAFQDLQVRVSRRADLMSCVLILSVDLLLSILSRIIAVHGIDGARKTMVASRELVSHEPVSQMLLCDSRRNRREYRRLGRVRFGNGECALSMLAFPGGLRGHSKRCLIF